MRNAIRPNVTVREASFHDYTQIAYLQCRYGMKSGSYEEWRHLWTNNPVYANFHPTWPIGWVLEAERDIVGYFGNIPTSYELNGKRMIAASAHSWVVAPEYRGYSLLLLHEYVRQTHADLLISNTVTRASCQPLTSLGLTPVPVGTWDSSSVWITTHVAFVNSWFARKKYPLRRVLSRPVSLALFARDIVKKESIRHKSRYDCNINLECQYDFDDRFDSLWEAIRVENPNTLLAVRSRAILEWHFQQAIREKRLWVVTATEGSCISAYAIFLLKRSSGDGVQRLVFVDFQARKGLEHLFHGLLTYALHKCHRDGIHLLQTTGSFVKGIGDVRHLAAYRLRQAAWSYWYKPLHRTLDHVLSDPGVWAPSLFDGDASL